MDLFLWIAIVFRYVITNAKTKPEDVEGYGSVYSESNSRATRSSSRLRGKVPVTLIPMCRKCNRFNTMTQIFAIKPFYFRISQKIDLSEEMIDQAYKEAEEAEREALEEAREKRGVLANRPMVYGPIPGTCTVQLYVERLSQKSTIILLHTPWKS